MLASTHIRVTARMLTTETPPRAPAWALVTGASARGGAAIARRLHAEGCAIVVHHSPRSSEAAALLADELNAARTASARLWCADLASQPLDIPDWLLQLGVETCVCNASVYERSALEDAERSRIDLGVHVLAHASILSALRPSLRSVVAVTDIHVDRAVPGYVWYTTSKAALQAMVLALAMEWAPRVRCNVVQPGTLPYPEAWTDHDRAQSILASIPMKRPGSFEEMAETVAWLALCAGYVTGQVIAVDGGRSRWLS